MRTGHQVEEGDRCWPRGGRRRPTDIVHARHLAGSLDWQLRVCTTPRVLGQSLRSRRAEAIECRALRAVEAARVRGGRGEAPWRARAASPRTDGSITIAGVVAARERGVRLPALREQAHLVELLASRT